MNASRTLSEIPSLLQLSANGEMMEDKTLNKLGLKSLPNIILLQNGKIIARGMKKQELYNKLDELLK